MTALAARADTIMVHHSHIFFRVQDWLVASHSLGDSQRLELLKVLPPLGGKKLSGLLAQMYQRETSYGVHIAYHLRTVGMSIS